MNERGPSLLVVAGEASGDLHAGRLLAALRQHIPDVSAFGLGGDELVAAGLEPLASSDEIAVVGITEVLRILRRARQIFHQLLDAVDQRGTRYALLVDAPDFNLRLAKQLKRRGVTVIYYISPQVWAWRRGRVHGIRRTVDLMMVLFPFEETFYQQYGMKAAHVGHPLVEEVPVMRSAWEDCPEGETAPTPIVSLLPGSRRSEVEALLPTLLATVARVAETRPIHVRLIRAPAIPRTLLEDAFAHCAVPVEVIDSGDRFEAIAGSHLALCASGTATLEVGLLTTPMIVVYRLKRWSYWLAKLLVKLPSFSLVNLVLDCKAVPERVQAATRPPELAADVLALLADRTAIDTMREHLGALRDRLGATGASERAAEHVAAVLQGQRVATQRREGV